MRRRETWARMLFGAAMGAFLNVWVVTIHGAVGLGVAALLGLGALWLLATDPRRP